MELQNKKIKLFRIVTSNYCVITHLQNTLKLTPSHVETTIFGSNVTFYQEMFPNIKFIDVPLKRDFNFILDLYSVIIISYHIVVDKPNYLHSIMTKSGLYSAIIGKLLFVPNRYHTFTGQVWATKTGIKRKLLQNVDKIIAILNTKCWTDSPSQSKFLFDHKIKQKGKILPYIWNGSFSGVDCDLIKIENFQNQISSIKNKFLIPEEAYVIGYVARKSIDKGGLEILKIFNDLLQQNPSEKYHLLYIGPREAEEQILKFLRANNSIKKYMTELEFVPNHYHTTCVCDIICLPSFREGFGSVVIDASALSIPTIGYNIPGLNDAISEGVNGFKVKCGDYKAFSKRLKKVSIDRELQERLKLSSRKYAMEKFDTVEFHKILFNQYQ